MRKNGNLLRVSQNASYTFTPTGDTELVAQFHRPMQIWIAQGPNTTVYRHGETLDTTGMSVMGWYSDLHGIQQVRSFTGYTIKYNRGNCLRKGDISVTIEFGGKTCTLDGLSVEPKLLNVSVAFADIVYNGRILIDKPIIAPLEGVVGKDKVSIKEMGTAPVLDNPYVGENKPVANYRLSLGGEDAGNYTLAPYELTANVVPAEQELSITSTAEMKTNGSLNLKDLVSGAKGDVSFTIADNEIGATLDGTMLKAGTIPGKVVLNVHAAAKDLNGDEQPEYKACDVERAITVTVTGSERGVHYSLIRDNEPSDFIWLDYLHECESSSPKTCVSGASYALPEPPTTTSGYNGRRKGTWGFVWTVRASGGTVVPVANNSFTMPDAKVNVTGMWIFTPNSGTRPEIVTTALPDAVTGVEYQASVEATSDTRRIEWAWSVDGLSGDLTASAVDTAYGNALQITGTPRTAGNYTVTVRAENDAGYDVKDFPLTVKQGYSLQVSAANPNAGTVMPESTNGAKGDAVQLTATAEQGYTFWKWQLAENSFGAISDLTANPATFTFGEGNAEAQALFRRETRFLNNIDANTIKINETWTGDISLVPYSSGNSVGAPLPYTKGWISMEKNGKSVGTVDSTLPSITCLSIKGSDLGVGKHTIVVRFVGTDDYAPCETSFVLEVVGK